MSIPELRWLLWHLVVTVQQTTPQILTWSQWRRWHQSIAKYDHDQRRGAWVEAFAA